jgi:hypothetical protein
MFENSFDSVINDNLNCSDIGFPFDCNTFPYNKLLNLLYDDMDVELSQLNFNILIHCSSFSD